MTIQASTKAIHSIVLDAGPIIKDQPSVSSLLQQCEQLITTPAVISEIRDQPTRTRLQTTLLPFLIQRNPKAESIRLVSDFARKTGDIAVLSRTDVQLLALSYDIECERNGGDWRLRRTPGQKRTNGPPPSKTDSINADVQTTKGEQVMPQKPSAKESYSESGKAGEATDIPQVDQTSAKLEQIGSPGQGYPDEAPRNGTKTSLDEEQIHEMLRDARLSDKETREIQEDVEDSDSEGWVTPSNIKRKQLEEGKADASGISEPAIMQVAMITTDFAMQNVLLQMNLNLLSPSIQRVRQVKTFILRCHACFNLVRDMSKQFCPRCGGPTLTRVTCTTNQNGEFKLHLKKNFQWNNRGNKFSVPKPVHGASNQRVKGGGKGGWGNDLMLSEDQKEYTRAITQGQRQKMKDLMDEDFLPSILSGDRSRQMGRPQVGASRAINSKKRQLIKETTKIASRQYKYDVEMLQSAIALQSSVHSQTAQDVASFRSSRVRSVKLRVWVSV